MESQKSAPDKPSNNPSSDGYLYDATLVQLDVARGILFFTAEAATHRVAFPHVSSFSVGAIGRLRLPAEGREFAFHAYPDQRLRRAPALDEPEKNRWGWQIGERRFTVHVGVIPGRAGRIISRDTQTQALELPREFIDFCDTRGITPESVLRGFIADLCGLMNFFACPREDGYSSCGSDERQQAQDYFKRAWGWVDEPEYRHSLRARRRKTRKQE
jgi:hypothetical protein